MNKFNFKMLVLLFFLVGVSASLFAQQDSTTTTQKEKKIKEKVALFPLTMRVGVDMASMLNNVRNPNKLRFNANAELSLNNVWFAVLEGGYGDAIVSKPLPNSFQYQNTGYFGRIGIEYNILHRIFDREAIVVGARYGFASFLHQLSYDVDDRYWDLEAEENNRTRYTRLIREDGMALHWAELTAGAKVNLAREGWLSHFYMSWLFRVQLRIRQTQNTLAVPTEIVGFGKNSNASNLGFSYFLSYEF